MADRCPNCDKPLADGPTVVALPKMCRRGDCEGCDACRALCWREWHGDVCQNEPVNWRARALAAEAHLADAEVMRVETLRLCEGVDAHLAEPIARAVLDAIRAVPMEELKKVRLEVLLNARPNDFIRDAVRDSVEAVRARLLAAGEAAAEGRR